MALYVVFEKVNDLRKKNKEIIISKMGFSKTAFFFSFIWGLSNKMYTISLINFCFFFIFLIFYIFGTIDPRLLIITMLSNSLYWGIFGNSLKADYIINKQSFTPVKFVNSNSKFYALITRLSEHS